VDCQVVHICDCIPARLQEALDELPKSLDETYERTLQRIKEENWEFAHRMFQFVSVAFRPLHVEELADLLAFDFKAGLIPKFRKDWCLVDPYCLHAPHFLPLSTTKVPPSFNSHIFPLRNS
jgi:hypothetical protein